MRSINICLDVALNIFDYFYWLWIVCLWGNRKTKAQTNQGTQILLICSHSDIYSVKYYRINSQVNRNFQTSFEINAYNTAKNQLLKQLRLSQQTFILRKFTLVRFVQIWIGNHVINIDKCKRIGKWFNAFNA